MLSCPPEDCLPYGCPGHEFARKGLKGCLDTAAAEGVLFAVDFVVINSAGGTAKATRTVAIAPPCGSGETYCGGRCEPVASCAQLAAFAAPAPPPPPPAAPAPTLTLLAPAALFLRFGSALGGSLAACPSSDGAAWPACAAVAADAQTGADLSSTVVIAQDGAQPSLCPPQALQAAGGCLPGQYTYTATAPGVRGGPPAVASLRVTVFLVSATVSISATVSAASATAAAAQAEAKGFQSTAAAAALRASTAAALQAELPEGFLCIADGVRIDSVAVATAQQPPLRLSVAMSVDILTTNADASAAAPQPAAPAIRRLLSYGQRTSFAPPSAASAGSNSAPGDPLELLARLQSTLGSRADLAVGSVVVAPPAEGTAEALAAAAAQDALAAANASAAGSAATLAAFASGTGAAVSSGQSAVGDTAKAVQDAFAAPGGVGGGDADIAALAAQVVASLNATTALLAGAGSNATAAASGLVTSAEALSSLLGTAAPALATGPSAAEGSQGGVGLTVGQVVSCLVASASCEFCSSRTAGSVDVRFKVAARLGAAAAPSSQPPQPSSSTSNGGGGGSGGGGGRRRRSLLTTFAAAAGGSSSSGSGASGGSTTSRQTSASGTYILSSASAGGGYFIPSRASNGTTAGVFDYLPQTKPAERSILLRNHIVGGLLLHQTRAPPAQRQQAVSASVAGATSSLSADSSFVVGRLEEERIRAQQRACEGRFSSLAWACRVRGLDSAPFGRDPVFMPGSSLFDPTVDASLFYNTSRGSPEVNPNGLPFGFFSSPLRGFPTGYAVFLDIAATEARALETLQFLGDGGFLDENTLGLSVEMVAYNPATFTVYYSRADLRFRPASVEVAAATHPVSLLVPGADPRTAAWCGVNAGLTALALAQLGKEAARFAAFARDRALWRRKAPFERLWRLVVVANVLLQCAAMGVFWGDILVGAVGFLPPTSFAVYDSLQADARYLLVERRPTAGALAALQRPAAPTDLLLRDPAAVPRWTLPYDPRGLEGVVDMITATNALATARIIYWLLQTVNVALLALRFFHSVAFHGRIGLATNATAAAMRELVDFAAVGSLSLVTLGFLCMYLVG